MLFDRRQLHVTAELLYRGSDLDRLDFIKSTNPIRLAPAEKLDRRASVGRARIRIADIDGEEFEEARARPFPALAPSAGRPLPRPAVFLMRIKSPMPDATSLGQNTWR
jgi:hypothetical protein